VESDCYIAQVKNYKGNVSVIEIRELYGVAAAQGKKALFFTSGGYTVEAKALAALIDLPLFRYVAEEGVLQGIGAQGQVIVDDGFTETKMSQRTK
jgi:ribosomal protein S19E (S16A)